MRRVRFLPLAVLAAALAAAPAAAAPPHNPFPPSLLETDFYTGLLDRGTARLKKVEVVEMVTFLANGRINSMGPGSAWFHPSQSRYDWKWLAQRYDKNRDGKITEDEWPDEEKSPRLYKLFERLDRDHRGQITAADFNWSMSANYVQEIMFASSMLRGIGADNGGKMTREDWDRAFERLSGGKGFITPEDLRDQFVKRPKKSSEPPPPEPTPLMLLKGLIAGDIGSPFEGPRVGQRAPDFRLKTFDGKGEIGLSDLRGKPTVLVFGSFT
jgi:Ca2+-binding EF-hand superfamily protein